MTDQEKLENIADCVEVDVAEISVATELETLENWDSVAVLSVISVINSNFNKYPNAKEILSCKTVGDLMELMK